MGIVGYGRIGREVARIARAFGMTVIVNDVRANALEAPETRFVGLDDLFRESDVVSLHCPLNPETAGMVNRARLTLMKPGAYIINTGRGPLVNEHDLAEALNSGRIAGAALDVLPQEPPDVGSPLIGARNCIITPHIAWAARAARKRLMNTVVENIRAFLAGNPVNVVNP
jgi:glycerate dehydrogenase